jgi:putative ABC transport system ATP-binding protein
MAEMPSIVLLGVDKEYRRDEFRIPVLVNLDLSVEEGEFLALMGPSGSGKTTLLNLIAGLDRSTRGEVVVHGQNLGELSEAQITRWRANNVGFIFQTYNLIPVLTAFENVELPLLLTHLSRRKRRENVSTALKIVGLDGREDHYPRQLSGGQEQRVSIARALVTDPDLLLLDEPFAALDEITRMALNDDLMRLWENRRPTVVFVTHSVFESVYLSTRIAVMTPRPGHVVAELPVDLPQSRQRSLRTSPRYAALCATVSEQLAKAMAVRSAVLDGV